MDHLCYLCLVFVMLSRLFITAMWSTTGKELASWPLFVMFNCVFVTFPCGILGQVWYLIVSIPDLCRLSYFHIGFRDTVISINHLYTSGFRIRTLASGEDPDEMPHDAAFHQGLHYLLRQRLSSEKEIQIIWKL